MSHAADRGTVAVLLGNVVAAAFMTGLIWLVQMVHYPLMAGWQHDGFGGWESLHRARIGPVVVPAMLFEGAAAVALLVRRPPRGPRWVAWAAAGLLLVVWGSTFLLQVPCHELLSAGWDPAVHARLVATNWIRTAGWTLRLVLLALLAARNLSCTTP
jgi:hypothetical protein